MKFLRFDPDTLAELSDGFKVEELLAEHKDRDLLKLLKKPIGRCSPWLVILASRDGDRTLTKTALKSMLDLERPVRADLYYAVLEQYGSSAAATQAVGLMVAADYASKLHSRYHYALTLLDQAEVLVPDHRLLSHLKGDVYRDAGDLDNAIKSYEAADADPNKDQWAHECLGYLANAKFAKAYGKSHAGS